MESTLNSEDCSMGYSCVKMLNVKSIVLYCHLVEVSGKTTILQEGETNPEVYFILFFSIFIFS